MLYFASYVLELCINKTTSPNSRVYTAIFYCSENIFVENFKKLCEELVLFSKMGEQFFPLFFPKFPIVRQSNFHESNCKNVEWKIVLIRASKIKENKKL